MEDDPGAADDERIIELSSIAAIFPEIVLDPHSPYRASLNIPVSPATPLEVRFQQLSESSAPNLPTPPTSTEPEAEEQNKAGKDSSQYQYGSLSDLHGLVHLPALKLEIHLPKGYPSNNPPIFDLSSSPAWIPEGTLQRLTKDGLRLWEELGKAQVIFTYIDHLQQAAEAGFDLARDLGRDITLSGDLKIALLDHDLKAKREAFEKETFECGICLEPQKGIVCHRLLLCSHVFCVACLQECYNKRISEGDVDNVKCLHPGCGKDPKTLLAYERDDAQLIQTNRARKHDPSLNPSELLQIPLSEEVVQRYVHLKRKKKLESDRNTVYCPRQWCQGAARSKKYPKPIDPMHDIEDVKSDSESEVSGALRVQPQSSKTPEIPMSERLCICEDCSYAFCSVCRKGWHGELISYRLCNPRSQKELSEEEQATAEYLALHSTPCPTCDAPCQKTMGCNHMICFKCRTHFCYLCSSYLMESNPYQHFNDKHNPCYMRLWELEGGDDEGAQVVAWDIPYDDESLGSDSDTDSSEDERAAIRGDALRDDMAHFSDEDEAGQEPLHRGRADPAAPENLRIEIVNFAGARVMNQQVLAAPFPPRQAAPPPAPAPPRRGGGAQYRRGRMGGRGRGRGGHVQNQIANVNANANPNHGGGRNRVRGNARAPRAAQARPPPDPHLHPREPMPNPIPAEVSDSSDTEDEVPLRFPRAAPAPAPGQGNHGQQQPAMLRQVGIDRFLQLAERDQEDEWDSDELEDEMEDLAGGARRGRRMWA